MPKPLTAAFVAKVKHSRRSDRTDERHSDGNGLMLSVQPSNSKSWVQRIVIQGRQRTFGLGGYPLVSLKEAREAAFDNRRIARSGGDPRKRRSIPNFETAAQAVIAIQRQAWKPGSTSEALWTSTLAAYVHPKLGDKPVDAITTGDVLEVLLPIWTAKRNTAQKVRQRISAVMKWAVAQGHRADDPAGVAVLQALPKGGAQTRHHAALPYADVADALRQVRESGAWPGTALAFEWLVLTAVRSGETRGALWAEVDGDTWTIPAERMKAGAAHRVPLSRQCLEVMERARELGHESLMFPSARGKTLLDDALNGLMRKLGIPAVPHGFRSSFRDWAAERTDAPRAVMEAALAHAVQNKTEAAYARSDLFERRRELMQEWADYLMPPDAL